MKKNNKLGLKIIMAVAAIGFLVCVGIIIAYYKTINSSNNKFEELQAAKNEAIESTVNTTEIEEANENTEAEAEEKYVSPIDFEKLKSEENKDIYAWIQVDGTTVDYPVLQDLFDDTYYLTHNLDGSFGYPGCIYTENYNTLGFVDPVTVVYGHYMKDGSMFSSLHRFMDRAFFDEHDSIVIYLPEEEKHYTVVAAYNTDDKRITAWYSFETAEGTEMWLDDLLAVEETEENHKRDMELSASDHYIVLETCVDLNEHGRYAVVAVEDKDE